MFNIKKVFPDTFYELNKLERFLILFNNVKTVNIIIK